MYNAEIDAEDEVGLPDQEEVTETLLKDLEELNEQGEEQNDWRRELREEANKAIGALTEKEKAIFTQVKGAVVTGDLKAVEAALKVMKLNPDSAKAILKALSAYSSAYLDNVSINGRVGRDGEIELEASRRHEPFCKCPGCYTSTTIRSDGANSAVYRDTHGGVTLKLNAERGLAIVAGTQRRPKEPVLPDFQLIPGDQNKK